MNLVQIIELVFKSLELFNAKKVIGLVGKGSVLLRRIICKT